MKYLIDTYLVCIEISETQAQVDKLLNRAANDDNLSNSEYEFIYSYAQGVRG